MPSAREHLEKAYRTAMENAADRRRMAYDEANYFVNPKDWQAWQEYQLTQANLREQAAADYRAMIETLDALESTS